MHCIYCYNEAKYWIETNKDERVCEDHVEYYLYAYRLRYGGRCLGLVKIKRKKKHNASIETETSYKL